MIHVLDVRKITCAGILLWLVFLAGCSELPVYSQPRIETGKTFQSANGIAYRDLLVTDFRAATLPDDLNSHAKDLNAHTAMAISTAPGAQYVFSKKSGSEGPLWCGHVENLVFHALMFPEKSWWSQALTKERTAYVLQHEQIHFAIMEIAARQLNRRVASAQDELMVCGADSKAVTNRMSAMIDRWMSEAQAESLKRHRNFDEDTSRRHAPKTQQWWYDLVMKELQDLARWQ